MRWVGWLLGLALLGGCDDPKPRHEKPHLSDDPRLAAIDGRCRAMCKLAGRCGYDDAAGRCVARSSEDCERSDGCLTSGVCAFEGGGCVGRSDEACQRSEQCRAAGACAFSGRPLDPCHAASDDHCRAAAICKTEGRCVAVGGRCVPPR